jgi:hypothetical protein
MTNILPFYANILLKLSLTQSILVKHSLPEYSVCEVAIPCQNFPPSVSGSSASLVGACWETLLPLLPCCSISNPLLSLVSFVHLAREISSEEELLRLGTLVPMNIEVPTKYILSQNIIVVF